MNMSSQTDTCVTEGGVQTMCLYKIVMGGKYDFNDGDNRNHVYGLCNKHIVVAIIIKNIGTQSLLFPL